MKIGSFLLPNAKRTIFYTAGFSLFGIMTGVSLTYVFSLFLILFISDSIIASIIVFSFYVCTNAFLRRAKLLEKIKTIALNKTDYAIIIVSLLVSTYLMFKSFRTSNDGMLLIARNLIFDFSHLLSIIRSISLGTNIPYTSPFVSNTDHIYHFLFAFLSAIGEKLSLPISFAINIPSILGFTLFLTIVYGSFITLFKLPRWTGIVGVIFVLFQSSLTFYHQLNIWGWSNNILYSLWTFPNYLFSGPFDGSIISLFITLNVFVNQRHLSFALGIFLLLFTLCINNIIDNKKKILLLGFLMGIIIPWHLTIIPFCFICIVITSLLCKRLNFSIYVSIGFAIGCLPYFILWSDTLIKTLRIISEVSSATTVNVTGNNWGIINFMLQNFGLLIIFVVAGLLYSRTYTRNLMIPLLLSSFLFFWALKDSIIDQKVFSVFLMFLKLTAVLGVYSIFKLKYGKIILLLLIPLTCISGILDFLVIKNDYLYPVKDMHNNPVIEFIIKDTKKDSIILSYRDMFDPVILSGRKQYFGFFRQPIFNQHEEKIREEIVRNIYESKSKNDLINSIDSSIDYVLIPTVSQANFYFNVNENLFKEIFRVVYEDEEQFIVNVQRIF